MEVGRATFFVLRVNLYLSVWWNPKCQCNWFFCFFFNIWVVSEAVILTCCLYSVFLLCGFPKRSCQSDLRMILQKWISLMWLPLYSGGKGCPGISDSSAVTPAAPRFSAVGVVPLLSAPGVSLLLSRSEGMNFSSMSSQELNHCCQEPHADPSWIVAWWFPFSIGPVVAPTPRWEAQCHCVGTGAGRAVGTVQPSWASIRVWWWVQSRETSPGTGSGFALHLVPKLDT